MLRKADDPVLEKRLEFYAQAQTPVILHPVSTISPQISQHSILSWHQNAAPHQHLPSAAQLFLDQIVCIAF
jgi:hypothetical protein